MVVWIIEEILSIFNMEKIIVGVFFSRVRDPKGKMDLSKNNMTRNDNVFGVKIEAPISFVIGRVTMKNARNRVGLKFVGVVEVRVT